MNGAFWLPGATRSVTPESDIIFAGGFGYQLVGGLMNQVAVGKRFAGRLSNDDDVFKETVVSPNLFDFGQHRFMQNNRPCPAVVEQVFIVLGTHPWIGGNGHGADLYGAKETKSKFR